jgi:hypothetical protein
VRPVLHLTTGALLVLTLGLAAACSDGDDGDQSVKTPGDGVQEPDADPSGGPPSSSPVNQDPPQGDDPPGGPIQMGNLAVGTLEITIQHPDAEPVTYIIGCQGDTATLQGEVTIDANAACAALVRSDVLGRLVDGPPADQICTEIYGGPDTARLAGEIDGRTIDATIDRANGCGIDDWDRLLVAVLPPALGIID